MIIFADYMGADTSSKDGAGLLSSKVAYFFLIVFILSYPFSIFLLKTLHIIAFSGLAVTLLINLCERKGRVQYSSEMWLLLTIYLYPFASILWTDYFSKTIEGLLLVSVNIPLVLLALHAQRFEGVNRVCVISRLVPLVMFAMALFIFIRFGSFRPNSQLMGRSVGSISNHAAALTLMCLPLQLWSLKRQRQNRFFTYGSLLASLLVVFLSEARAAFVLLIMIFLLSAYWAHGRFDQKLGRFVFGTSLFITVSFLVVLFLGWDKTFGQVIHRFEDSQLLRGLLTMRAEAGLGDYARTSMYLQGLELVKIHWMFGAGYNALYPFMEGNIGFGLVSHNLIITALGEQGIMGLFLYALFFMKIISLFLKGMKKNSPNMKDYSSTGLIIVVLFFAYSLIRPYQTIFVFPIIISFMYKQTRFYLRDSYRIE